MEDVASPETNYRRDYRANDRRDLGATFPCLAGESSAVASRLRIITVGTSRRGHRLPWPQRLANLALAEPVREPAEARMVKELDLFESNNGCGMNGLSSEKHSKRT